MQNKGSFLRSALTLIVLFLVFALLLTGLNVWAGPRIELSEASQALGPLMDIFPGAQGFDLLYSSDGSAGSELTLIFLTFFLIILTNHYLCDLIICF